MSGRLIKIHLREVTPDGRWISVGGLSGFGHPHAGAGRTPLEAAAEILRKQGLLDEEEAAYEQGRKYGRKPRNAGTDERAK